jgi:T5orf172 domain
MSGKPGYVYALINGAMPGLVKVGKTTRDPAGRAQELSGATGVATPFMVVFEQMFGDCDAAEAAIHRSLEQSGCRLATNREFFQASPSQVIKFIMAVHAAMGETDPVHELSGDPEDRLGQLAAPWQHLLDQADAYDLGRGEYLEDHYEAYRLYEDAARLGSAVAMDSLGWMNWNGEGVRRDDRAALQWWKDGAARGNYYCHASMANAFALRREFQNAGKRWAAFFRGRNAATDSDFSQFERPAQYHLALADYVIDMTGNGITVAFVDEIREHRAAVQKILAKMRTDEGSSDAFKAESWRATRWIEDNFKD